MYDFKKSMAASIRRCAIMQYRLKSKLTRSALYKEIFTDRELMRLKKLITKNAMRRVW